ncbi:MAG: hypothetical protein NTZ84_03765 [Candidatus Nealsonbacteria bacterium]|nr:hypothetical protein [Candidatus Nealsonbacteria bacterium]
MIFVVGYLAMAWTEPSAPAPGNNVPAPINIGTSTQIKDGALGINGLFIAYSGIGVNNQKITDVLTPVSGTDAVNKDYVDAKVVSAAGGGTYNSCYVLNSDTSGQTCATGYTAIAWKNTSGTWSFDSVYGSYTTAAMYVTIGGQMLQVGFGATNATIYYSTVITYNTLSNSWTPRTVGWTCPGRSTYTASLVMSINGSSWSAAGVSCDGNAGKASDCGPEAYNGHCETALYTAASSFALCCK